MRRGRTYSRHFALETRQHELFGLDLGEGPKRRVLVTGFLCYLVWVAAMFLIFGLPSRISFTLYFTPPAVLTYYGTQPSRANERRWNLANWVLVIRYLFVGHRPIINGGRRAADRSEWLPARARLGERAEAFVALPGMGIFDSLLGAGTPQVTAGRSVKLAARPRLYGPDYVYRCRKRTRGRQKGRTS